MKWKSASLNVTSTWIYLVRLQHFPFLDQRLKHKFIVNKFPDFNEVIAITISYYTILIHF